MGDVVSDSLVLGWHGEDQSLIEKALVDLVHAKSITHSAIERARRAAEQSNERVDEVLIKLGLVDERTLRDSWSRVTGFAVLAPGRYPAEPVCQELLQPRFLRSAKIVPVASDENYIELAIADPVDRFSSHAVAAKCRRNVVVFLATRSEIEAEIDRLYEEQIPEDFEANSLSEPDLAIGDVERLRDQASDAPAIRLTDLIIKRAVEMQASDIHLTVSKEGTRLRYRIDGILRDFEPHPTSLHAAIVSRLKVLADLDIAERRLPQDGRIRIGVDGREVDLRIATMPHLSGEGAVLRILDQSAASLNLTELGLRPDTEQSLLSVLENPNGILLVTGPTGSGKTTTLYAALRELACPERNVVTVEDPVEYYLDRVTQIQVARKIGLDFPVVLRSVLRQDPDVIMIGEIRDGETASIANQAALTGHFVLATLHTNSAAASIPRLIDMGVESYLLASTIRGVVSQRLVRRLCLDCRKPTTRTQVQAAALSHQGIFDRFPELQIEGLYSAGGCHKCNGTGYRGRLAIAELLIADGEMRNAIMGRRDADHLESIAGKSGFVSLMERGIQVVASGETSLAELLRVTGTEAEA